jgi:hypothetical protein
MLHWPMTLRRQINLKLPPLSGPHLMAPLTEANSRSFCLRQKRHSHWPPLVELSLLFELWLAWITCTSKETSRAKPLVCDGFRPALGLPSPPLAAPHHPSVPGSFVLCVPRGLQPQPTPDDTESHRDTGTSQPAASQQNTGQTRSSKETADLADAAGIT